jgi:hypothetical protein
MIIKVKYETDNPSIFVVENPIYQDTPQVEMFAKFKTFRPFLGKSYSANLIHKWETINNDYVLVHFVVDQKRSIDDFN